MPTKNRKSTTKRRRSNVAPDALGKPSSESEFEIVALRIPIGIVTVQARASWLADASDQLDDLRRQISTHAAKCFDQAVEAARAQWEKMKR